MNIINCLSPKRIFNKYTGEWVHVPCLSCEACCKNKATRWINRLETESLHHPFVFFVTLTYDNYHLPLLHTNLPLDDKQLHSGIFKKDTVFLSEKDDFSISFKDFMFTEKKDITYFHRCFKLFNGIPYASKTDIQLFHKRLNKFFYEHVTNQFKNFRFFLVSEYGSTTFRPHFHGIYFVDDQRVANVFSEGIRKCWQVKSYSIGRCDCQLVRGSANSYVAQYLNCVFDIPSFYKESHLKPFYLQSRRPSIGNVYQSTESIREIFDSGAIRTVVADTRNKTSFIDVPLQRFIEDRLYPKFSFFSKVSGNLRAQLYQSAARFVGKSLSTLLSKQAVNVFCSNIMAFLVSIKPKSTLVDLWNYLRYLVRDPEQAISNLKRLFYVSRRFLLNCCDFGLSCSEYLSKIIDYYDRKEYDKLKRFYDFQQNYDRFDKSADPQDLAYLYPEFVHDNQSCLPNLSETSFFKMLRSQSIFYKLKSTKSHFKNHYLDCLRDNRRLLFNLINSYHYA